MAVDVADPTLSQGTSAPPAPVGTPGGVTAPGAEGVTPGAAPAAPSTPEAEPQSKPFKDRLWDTIRGGGKPASETPNGQVETQPDAEWKPPSTREEYQAEVQRAAQAETDRREAKRQADARESASRDHAKRLRDAISEFDDAVRSGDWAAKDAAADKRRAIEREVELPNDPETIHTQAYNQARAESDTETLDPLLEALSKAKLDDRFKGDLDENGYFKIPRRDLFVKGLHELETHYKNVGLQELVDRMDGDSVEAKSLRKAVIAALAGDETADTLVNVRGGPASSSYKTAAEVHMAHAKREIDNAQARELLAGFGERW